MRNENSKVNRLKKSPSTHESQPSMADFQVCVCERVYVESNNVLATSLWPYTVTILQSGNILTESQPRKDQSANQTTAEILSIESDRGGFGRALLSP